MMMAAGEWHFRLQFVLVPSDADRSCFSGRSIFTTIISNKNKIRMKAKLGSIRPFILDDMVVLRTASSETLLRCSRSHLKQGNFLACSVSLENLPLV